MEQAIGDGPRAAPNRAIFVLLAGAAFSTSGPLARWARPTHPLLVAFGRLALAAVILGLVDWRALGPAVRGLPARKLFIVFVAGALLAAHFGLFLLGLDRTSLPAAVALVSLEPLSVVVCAFLFLGARPTVAEWIGVGLATAGAVVVARGSGAGEHRLAGDLLVLVAVLLYGLYLTVARALKDSLPARSYAVLVYASASIALLPALALAPDAFVAPAWPPPAHGVVAIVAIAVVPTVLGHTAVQTASRTLPPAVVALVSPGETLGAIAIGAALLGAVPTATEIVGAAIILIGTAIAILAPEIAARARGARGEPC
jgi:drug/metabolite transporter (DMT)-like permease